MKTISILLVTVGICLAKPPAARFPDFLAPFRGIFGPRGGHNPPGDRTHPQPYDSAGAETGKQSAPFPGEDNNSEVNYRPYFPPPSFSNSPYEGDGHFSPSEGHGRPPFPQDSRHHQFHGESGPPPSHYPSERPTFRRPTRQHPRNTFVQLKPQVIHHHHPPSSPGYPNFQPQNSQPQEQSTGFTDFAFNPADFDRGNYGSEERQAHPMGGRPPSNFQPSKSIPNFPAESPPRNNGGPPGPDIITLADLQKGGSNRNGGGNGVYFDEVYRQPPGGHLGNSIFQSEEPMRGGGSPGPRRPPPQFPSGASSEESSSYGGETRRKRVYFRPPPNSQEEVHYGKPMAMSSSAPPTIFKKPRKHINQPVLLASPTFQGPKVHSEPIAAASGNGLEGLGGEGQGHGDRILYHVAGHAGPYSYRFGYDTGNGYNRMFRHEEKDGNGFVKGKYGFHDKNGKLQVINYHAHPTEGFHSERAH